MNPAYVATYRRHRRLFFVPIVLVAGLALWSVLGAPKLYQSSANLWSGAVGGSASEALGAPPPAAQEQTMLNELLKTQYFQKNIAERSHLADYLRQHPSAGWGPSAVTSKLRATPPLEDRIATALGPKRVTSLVQGPHVLKISYTAPTPALAIATLKALLREYETQRVALSKDALTAYGNQVVQATKALTNARTSVATFLRENNNRTSDPQYRLLLHAERDAATRLARTTDAFSQASSDALGQASAQPSLRVVDPPTEAVSTASGMRKAAFALVAGLFGGALISCLGIVALTKARRPAVSTYDAPTRGAGPVDQRPVVPSSPAPVAPVMWQEPAPVARAPEPVAPADAGVAQQSEPIENVSAAAAPAPAPAPVPAAQPVDVSRPVVAPPPQRAVPIEKVSARTVSAVQDVSPPPADARPRPAAAQNGSRFSRKRRIRDVTPEVVPEIVREPRAGAE